MPTELFNALVKTTEAVKFNEPEKNFIFGKIDTSFRREIPKYSRREDPIVSDTESEKSDSDVNDNE